MRFVLAGVCFFPDAAPALCLRGIVQQEQGRDMRWTRTGDDASQLEARRWVCEGYPPNQKRCNFPCSWQTTLEQDQQQLMADGLS
jgi:hypothetical protein